MAEATFGERLAEARRIKGETIEEVSEQLRIRPSIILAMETSSFSHMPHKGYARNMISSYARYLGLDSTRITEQFLREFRRWESTGRRGSGSNASSLHQALKRYPEADEPANVYFNQENPREKITAASRNQDRASVWGNNDKRDTNRKFRAQIRERQDDQSLYPNISTRRTISRRVEHDPPPTKQLRTNDYVGKPPRKSVFSGVSSSLSSRPMLLIIGLVILFVALLILWAVLASTCNSAATTDTPVTPVTNTDSGLDEDEAVNTTIEDTDNSLDDDQYGPFELVVEVVEGESWLQIDVDGQTPVGQVCVAPWSETFTVTSESKIEAGAPANVRVYRNGIEVSLDASSGLGVLELKVENRPIVQNAQDADAESQN